MNKSEGLNPLALDKETIAKLDEAQLLAISGGVSDENDQPAKTTCETGYSCVGGDSCPKGNSC